MTFYNLIKIRKPKNNKLNKIIINYYKLKVNYQFNKSFKI